MQHKMCLCTAYKILLIILHTTYNFHKNVRVHNISRKGECQVFNTNMRQVSEVNFRKLTDLINT